MPRLVSWILAGAISMPLNLLLRQISRVFTSDAYGPLSMRASESVQRSHDEKALPLGACPRRGPAPPGGA
jgi:hypothetical protein